MPCSFTIDLGVVEGVPLTRGKLWQRGTHQHIVYPGSDVYLAHAYNNRNISKFEVWGSMAPNPDGSWDSSWTLLLDAEIVKPSGLPRGTNTEEDIAQFVAGDDFIFPATTTPVRYIRIKVTEVFDQSQGWFITDEIRFWGMLK